MTQGAAGDFTQKQNMMYLQGFTKGDNRTRSATYAQRYKERLKNSPGAYQRYQLQCRDAMRRLRQRRRLEKVVAQSVMSAPAQAVVMLDQDPGGMGDAGDGFEGESY